MISKSQKAVQLQYFVEELQEIQWSYFTQSGTPTIRRQTCINVKQRHRTLDGTEVYEENRTYS